MENKSEPFYIVVATVFDNENQQLTHPMSKEDVELAVTRLKDAMKPIDKEFQAFKNIKTKKYEPESLFANKQKNDPYDYSILDKLDKEIKAKK